MSDDNILKYIEKDISLIQKFMSENLGSGRKMTGAEIYNALKDQLKSDVNEGTFKASLSYNVRAGKITGVEGKKSIGYIELGDTVKISRKRKSLRETTKERLNQQRKSEVLSKVDVDDIDNDDSPRFQVQISRSVRLVLSKNYVARQKLYNGAGWVSQSYHSTFGDALRGTVKHLIQDKVKEDPTIVMLKDTITRLNQIEASIMAELTEKLGDIPLNTKVSELDTSELSA